MLQNNFSYTGRVKIKTRNEGIESATICYNNGTDELFTFYAKALSGVDVHADAPGFIDIYQGIKSPISSVTTSRGVSAVSRYTNADTPNGRYVTRIVASIPRYVIDEKKLTNTADNANYFLCLCNSANKVFAFVKLNMDGTRIQEMQSASQIIVEWDLYVENPAATNTDNTDGGNN